eukprot:58049_1
MKPVPHGQQEPVQPQQQLTHESVTSYAQIPNMGPKVPPPVPGGGGGPPPVPSAAIPPPVPQQAVDDGLTRFRKMAKMGVPKSGVSGKMRQEGVSEDVIEHYLSTGTIDGNFVGSGGGGGGPGGPPPVPSGAVPPPFRPQKMSPAQMAMMSQQSAVQAGAYSKPKPNPMMPGRSQALLSGIKGGISLKKTVQVKRVIQQDSRSVLLMALKKKGQTGLKHVKDDEKNVKKEEEIDNTIYAILNRRKFMADDSDSDDDDDSWGSSDEI